MSPEPYSDGDHTHRVLALAVELALRLGGGEVPAHGTARGPVHSAREQQLDDLHLSPLRGENEGAGRVLLVRLPLLGRGRGVVRAPSISRAATNGNVAVRVQSELEQLDEYLRRARLEAVEEVGDEGSTRRRVLARLDRRDDLPRKK